MRVFLYLFFFNLVVLVAAYQIRAEFSLQSTKLRLLNLRGGKRSSSPSKVSRSAVQSRRNGAKTKAKVGTSKNKQVKSSRDLEGEEEEEEEESDEYDDDDSDVDDDEYDSDDNGDNDGEYYGRGSAKGTGRKKRKPKTILDVSAEAASDAMNMGLKMARGAVKSTVDLAANKHVSEYQVYGKWRFMQEIEVKKGVFISSPATIEFKEDGTVVTVCDGQKFESEYVFKERPWPRTCSIYFQARAFQGPKDTEPINMFYKGHFKRSMMNPNVVLIRGKVYKLAGKMFWKQQTKVGTFKATKRKYG